MPLPDFISTTRDIYDFSAAHYASAVGTTISTSFERPIDMAMLDTFAAGLLPINGARVLDIGCGVGRVTSYLYGSGLDISGVDLSPEMVAVARSAHPHLSFEVATMTDLPVARESLTGAVLWYSIIHTPPDRLHEVWAELARVVKPGGRVLLGFQAGDNEHATRENAFGSSSTMTWYRHKIDDVLDGLEHGGFVVQTSVWRAAELAHETTPQAFLTFQRRP